MSHLFSCSASNRIRIPFKDLQGISNDQLHVISDLLTGICLSLRALSYGKTMLFFMICLARSGWVTISYSKDMSVILYMVSDFGGDPCDIMTRS